MKAKTIEIRDRATCIPALAVQLGPACESDCRLFARAGFGPDPFSQGGYVVLVHLTDMRAQWDPHAWGGRTMPVAHDYLVRKFEDVTTGDVVDVEFILGETAERKASEL